MPKEMPVTRHCVKAIIFNRGKLLIMKRANEEEDLWDTPGGVIEEGETAYGALVREIEEETGCSAPTLHRQACAFKMQHYTKEEMLHFRFFYVTLEKRDIIVSDEHEEYRWILESELDQYKLMPAVAICFRGRTDATKV